MTSLIDHRLMELIHAAGWTLLHFLWQGGLLGFAFALAMICTRDRSAQQRYAIGCATLAAMAVAPIVTFVVVVRGLPSHGVDQPSTLMGTSTAALSTPATVNVSLLAVVVVWAVGAALCSAWLLGGWLHATRLRRLHDLGVPERCRRLVERLAAAMGVRAAVRMVESASVAAPIAIGWLAPVILLPAGLLAGLSARQLEAIIAHELAHIRRFDYLVNLLQTIVESLLFFHPAVWWVSRCVRQEREYCCDDIAAAMCGDRVLYARALTELEALRGVSPRLGLSSNGGSLMKRIVRLVSDSPSHCSPSRWSALLASGALLATASAAFALMHAPAAPPTPAVVAEVTQPDDDCGFHLSLVPRFEGRIAVGDGVRLPISVQGVEVHPSADLADDRAQFAWRMAAASDESAPPDGDVQRQRWVRLDQAEQGSGEMPTEGLLHAARLAYPANLFEFMSWISPEAHELIKPPVELDMQGVWLLAAVRREVSLPQIRFELQPRVVESRIYFELKDLDLAAEAVDTREVVIEGDVIQLEVELRNPVLNPDDADDAAEIVEEVIEEP